MSKDPIEEEGGINLYGFLMNDGLNSIDDLGLFDLFGLFGKGIECKDVLRLLQDAKLANAAYEQDADLTKEIVLPEGWHQVAHVDENSGLNYRVYKNSKTGERVLAFRGTERGAPGRKDWRANRDQVSGSIGDKYRQVYELSKNTKLYSSDRVVGHSLGGGLAAAYGAATGKPVTTFNAAGLHSNTSKLFGNNGRDYKDHVKSVVMRGEALNMAQDAVPFILPDSKGDRSYVSPDGFSGPLDLHSMKEVIKALERLRDCCRKRGEIQ
jgi:hypothetical protein